MVCGASPKSTQMVFAARKSAQTVRGLLCLLAGNTPDPSVPTLHHKFTIAGRGTLCSDSHLSELLLRPWVVGETCFQ